MMSMTVAKCKSSGSNETLSLYCGPLSLVFSDEGNVCILSRQHSIVYLYFQYSCHEHSWYSTIVCLIQILMT